jgi:predicted regulator of Ras-like GTPase activity (Roadblock/LC7/MglB family)
MNFKEGLERIAEKLDDCLGVAIVDQDGILVEEYKNDSLIDLAALAAEYSALLKGADKASLSVELGPSREITVLMDTTSVVIKKINEGYFLLMALQSDRNIGKGRFFMKREAAVMVEDL